MKNQTYTGILRDVYYAPRKFIVAFGRRLEFIDGVATGIPEYAAQMLLAKRVLSEITAEQMEEAPNVPDDVEIAEEEISVVEDVLPEPVLPPEENEEDENQGEEAVEVERVDGVVETSDGVLTKTELSDMYNRLGTWTAVAEELAVSTAVLRKYRETLGLI